MPNKSIKQLKKEGLEDATRELKAQFGDIAHLPPLKDPNAPQTDEKTGQPIIQARDAEIGKDYLTVGMYYKVTLLKKYGDEDYVSSVQVQAEGAYLPTAIAGGTDLIAYQEQFHKPRVIDTPLDTKEKAMPKDAKSTKALSVPKEKKVKMSSIITPLLLEGKHTAESIADAVIAKIPEKKKDRDKLISWIGGSYITYLTKNPKLCNGKTPSVKPSPASEKVEKKAPATQEKAAKADRSAKKAEKKAPAATSPDTSAVPEEPQA